MSEKSLKLKLSTSPTTDLRFNRLWGFNVNFSLSFIDCSGNQCNSCPGGEPLNTANQCEAFACVNEETCNKKGKCNDTKDACVCDADFAGTDCTLDLSSKLLLTSF